MAHNERKWEEHYIHHYKLEMKNNTLDKFTEERQKVLLTE